MTVDSSGNVGIGTASPSANLDVASSNATIHLTDTDDTTYAEIRNNGGTFTIASDEGAAASNSSINFRVDGTQRMVIDSSGNLLVGKTALGGAAGTTLYNTGLGYFVVDGNRSLLLDRLTSDGNLMEFRKAGTTVGSIGTNGGYIYIGSSDVNLRFHDAADAILPATSGGASRDNVIDMGASGARFDDIFATNGTIQTSDRNEKQDIAALTSAEMLVGKRISALFKTFRWKDKVAAKGNDARTHTGIIAQDVQAAFTAESLDAGDYSLFISSTWWEHDVEVPAVEAVAEVTDEDGNVTTEAVEAKDAYTRTNTYDTEDEAPEGATSKTRMGIRYPELLSFVAAYNEQRFAAIETRLTALEG
jgi:hypothetical protein